MVTRRITDAGELVLLSKFNSVETPPRESRACLIHQKAVTLHYESTGGSVSGFSGPPIAVLTGCCDEAISQELLFINQTLLDIATREFTELGIKDFGLSTEANMATEAGDYQKSNAAEAERAALVPLVLKSEEKMLRLKIEVARSARENIARRIRGGAGDTPAHQLEEVLARFTSTFDKDISQAEQQLENNLEEQRRLGII